MRNRGINRRNEKPYRNDRDFRRSRNHHRDQNDQRNSGNGYHSRYENDFYEKDEYGRTQYSRYVDRDREQGSERENKEYWSPGGYNKYSRENIEANRNDHYDDEYYSDYDDGFNNEAFEDRDRMNNPWNHGPSGNYHSGTRGRKGFERTGRRVRETWKDHSNDEGNRQDDDFYVGEHHNYRRYGDQPSYERNNSSRNYGDRPVHSRPSYSHNKRHRKRVYEW
ncbi:MAG: hypothetical protein K0S12_1474 [Bacteroidetes bacterium]|nr:hypothetical protein [Bacteroidota bacterium]